MIIKFDNSYAKLPQKFYTKVLPVPVKNPQIGCFNVPLAKDLGLDFRETSSGEIAEIFSGNKILKGSEPIALAYAGHQFGHFVPQLGDGRAILLGEMISKNGTRYDIQLKGSGQTPYSRQGDGRAALGPMIREYIVSEAMHALQIKTTRSLALVTTGESVYRDTILPGAILTRIAESHVRIGSFEYFAAQEDYQSLKILADYVIERLYPEIKAASNPYLSLLECFSDKLVSLIASWIRIGFIHGVMNTDNMALSGETLDYGPCAFMDEYDSHKVFSSIDYYGRYAFYNQANTAFWNLLQLGKCLAFLIKPGNSLKGLEMVTEIVHHFKSVYKETYLETMQTKIGLTSSNDKVLVGDLLKIMQQEAMDYTLTFRYLSYQAYDTHWIFKNLFTPSLALKEWIKKWQSYLKQQNFSTEEISRKMLSVNPAFIPRNHKLEELIKYTETTKDFSKMQSFVNIISNPYKEEKEMMEYMRAPTSAEKILTTFCGT